MEINFPIRFIIDNYFVEELLLDKAIATKTILKLSEIHKNSKHYPMSHNLILDECFMDIIKEKRIRGPALIGAMHPEQCPFFLKDEKNIQTKIIKYAINVANKKPYGVIILTSKDKENDYFNNEHYENPIVKSAIKIFSGKDALRIVEVVLNSKD